MTIPFTPSQLRDMWNEKRFLKRFAMLSAIGATSAGGVHRPFGSAAEERARAYIVELLEGEAGLSVEIDAVANIWASHPGTDPLLPAITLGSHHDSVPDGGRFDGALGVLVAVEVVQSLREAGYANHHALQVVSFTAEEPNEFDLSTLGSRTVAGRLDAARLLQARARDDRPLSQALKAAGGDLSRLRDARKSAREISAFLELHIEQGRRLERAGQPVGVVTSICGIYRETVTVRGEPNHSGTTVMADRHDALLAASELALALEQIARAQADDMVATVGRFSIAPNATNIIPGTCEFVLEIRGSDTARIHGVRDRFAAECARVASARGVVVQRAQLLDQAPQPLTGSVMEALEQAARTLGIAYASLPSMAGHDATHVASFTRAGMLFVPSLGGKSHCPEENSRIEDIGQAARVLFAATVALDAQLQAPPEAAQVREEKR